MPALFFRIAAALCFLAVALGAFGARNLRSTLETHGMLDVWNKAVLYHFIHAIALLVLALFGATNRGAWLAPFCRHFSFQRKPIPNGVDPAVAGLAWTDHTPRRPLFSCRLGVAYHRAAIVEAPMFHGQIAAPSVRR